jgi:hypothetical protein
MGHNNDKAMLNLSGMNENVTHGGVACGWRILTRCLVTPNSSMPHLEQHAEETLYAVWLKPRGLGFVKLYHFATEG